MNTKTFIRFWLVFFGIQLVATYITKASTGLTIIGISIFLALALRPLVQKLNAFLGRHLGVDKNHKTASAVIAYSLIVITFSAIIITVGPVFINETVSFIKHLPETFEQSVGGWNGINEFGRSIGINDLQAEISKNLINFSNQIVGNLPSTVVTSISTVGDILAKSIFVLVLTLLFMLEGPEIMQIFWNSLRGKKEDDKSVSVMRRVVSRMANVVSTFVSRQAIVALIDGIAVMLLVFVLALIFQFSATLAIPMGLFAFVFYLIPMFGQVISACLISLILAFTNPISALTFMIIYIVYAQVENNFIAPKIQGDALKLPAVVILSAMIIGMYMFGLLGALISIPIAGCIRILVDEYPNIKAARE